MLCARDYHMDCKVYVPLNYIASNIAQYGSYTYTVKKLPKGSPKDRGTISEVLSIPPCQSCCFDCLSSCLLTVTAAATGIDVVDPEELKRRTGQEVLHGDWGVLNLARSVAFRDVASRCLGWDD